MANEIELKYLIENPPSLEGLSSEKIVQAYLKRFSEDSESTIRVRTLGEKSFITIKGTKTGLTQKEFEYEIPTSDAEELFKMCEPGIIEKTRYYIPHGEHTIELDIFGGKLQGLILAEIELKSENDKVEIPSWFSKDVSSDNNYSNAGLSKISISSNKKTKP